jgi:hypothetical protein
VTDAYIIETATVTAGIVAAQGRGFLFYAAHPDMYALDGRTFSSPRAAQRAAEKLARIAAVKPSPSRQGPRGPGRPRGTVRATP